MTIVAYRSGIMAADSSCWRDITEVTKIKKICRVQKGLVGAAGNIRDMAKFLGWLKDGAIEEEYPTGEYEAIVVDPTGRITLWEGYGYAPIIHKGQYCAIGSGADIALGALFVGGSALNAVRAAIKHNAKCRGPVSVWRLNKEIE